MRQVDVSDLLSSGLGVVAGINTHLLTGGSTSSRRTESQYLAMATARFPGKSVDVAAANWTAPALGRPVCVNGTPWILYLLEECVDNVWEYCSVVIGLISMFCFLLSTLP